MKRYHMLVKTAMGYEETRGDQVEVINVPFDQAQAPEEEHASPEGRAEAFGIATAKRLLIPVLAVLVFFILLRVLLRRGGSGPRNVRLPRQLPKSVAELEAELPSAAVQAPGHEPAADEVAWQHQNIAEVRGRVLEQAKRDPLRAAAVAREWLKEG